MVLERKSAIRSYMNKNFGFATLSFIAYGFLNKASIVTVTLTNHIQTIVILIAILVVML